MKATLKNWRLGLALFLVSAAGIAYELTFMRLFSVTQWHHFAYMMISVAMLGFGAAGTLLSLFEMPVRHRATEIFVTAVFLLAVALPGCYISSQYIPFETFRIVNDHTQWIYLLCLYCLLAVPFFLVSVCITTAFLLRPDRIAEVYFLNMAGSGVGAFFITICMYWISPEHLVLPLTAACIVALLAVGSGRSLRQNVLTAGGLAVVAVVMAWSAHVPPRVSEYKGLSYALDLPDATKAATATSPISHLTAVRSQYIRETPGQISNYPMSEMGPIPEQIGLYFDAGAVSVINRLRGDGFEEAAFLDYVTAALPYQMLDEPEVFVVGAGGGTDVVMALSHSASHVTAAEIDPNVYDLVNRRFGEFSGHLYDRDDVSPMIADGRGWLKAHPRAEFDLIQIALIDSFTSSSAGVHALSESYLYTREAVAEYYQSLKPDGMLSITRWLKTPPRDAIKMFATLVEGAELAGASDPGGHVAWIRSWNTATMVLFREPLSASDIAELRAFAESRNFDLCYYPGIAESEANRYVILEEPTYYRAAQAILSPQRERFYERFLYYVRPATDDRPYFFRFFKWSSIPRLVRGMGQAWIPFVEWGYLTLLATITQGVAAGLLLIVVPMVIVSRSRREEVAGSRLAVIAYFGLLGLAFMFLEIAFIQKVMLFLAYPVYAVAAVLTAFLLFSGLGSWAAGRLRRKYQIVQASAVIAIVGLAVLYIVFANTMFDWGQAWPDWLRIFYSLILLGPLAFAMGMPFPLGMQEVSDGVPPLVPWAWAVNGCLSVIGATLATLIAVHWGFRLLVVLACLCYMTTIPAYGAITRGSKARQPR